MGREWRGGRARLGRMARRRSGRASVAYRAVTIGLLLLMAAALLLPRLVFAQDDPYTQITPKSPEADQIQTLYKIIFWLALAVFIGVQAAIVYTVMRYRRRGDTDKRPVQVHGNRTLEIAWTVIPAIILVAIFIPTLNVLVDLDPRTDDAEFEIEVYGKQWWWEVRYTDDLADVVTANEIYVPVGQEVTMRLNSANVIHSFWVPQLMGKMDVIPGHTNSLRFTAREPGMYYGECAEYCGTAHAYMRFKVMAVPRDQFDRWVAGWRQGANSNAAALAPEGDIERYPQVFGLCLGCHRVGGVDKNAQGAELGEAPTGLEAGNRENQILGPNLSMVACRTTLAAGILPNDEESLRTWLANPGGVKPGNYMATMIEEGTLSPEQIDQLVAYLSTLAPEDGCPEITGVNAEGVERLADSAPPPAQAMAGNDPRYGVGFVA